MFDFKVAESLSRKITAEEDRKKADWMFSHLQRVFRKELENLQPTRPSPPEVPRPFSICPPGNVNQHLVEREGF
jgi:hypothetical protein